MERSLEERWRAAEQYSRTLEDSFRNNLQVIEEQEREAEALRSRLSELEQENQTLRQAIELQEERHDLEARAARADFNAKLDEQQRETQEVTALLEAKYRREMEAVSQRLTQELRAARGQLADRDESSRRVLLENSRLNQLIKDLKSRELELEGRVGQLNEEKRSMGGKMALHEQELEGIRVCSANWEEALKQKLRDAQEERQKVEEEYRDYKMTAKEKMRKMKDDLTRSVNRVVEEHEDKIRQAAIVQKELQFKLDKAEGEKREVTKQLELLRDSKQKLDATLSKYQDHERAYAWNEKERDQLQQMLEQQKRDTKIQVESLTAELKKLQEKLDEINGRREEKEKAVERMKVEILNNTKENAQIKKENTQLRLKLESLTKEQGGVYIPPEATISKPYYERAYDSKGFDMVESAKVENDVSKVYTEDVGLVDSKWFEAKSPKHQPNNSSPKAKPNREVQLMKQASQLQLELQDCRVALKRYAEEIESLKKMVEERNREISLHRDRANVYWEKANDKEQQVNALKEINSELKANYSDLAQELKRFKESEAQWRTKDHEYIKLQEKVGALQKEIAELEQEIGIVTKDRDLMEQISSDLRADNHTLKELLAGNQYPDDNSIINAHQDVSKSQQEFHRPDPDPREEETVPIQPERQRFPKKLHDLVREKKMLSISGKRAAMEERQTEARLEQIHVGTDSQKEVLERIKVRNKTPPKIANYAEMKKEKERRSHQLETLSQKEVYERLKSRQNPQALSPERGVNYNYLRDIGAE